MKITKSQLKQLIKEEFENNIEETILNEAFNVGTIQTAGISVLKEMMNDPNGRERLANLITALPELFTQVCEVWGSSAVGRVLKKMCGGGIRALSSPMYALAHVLKQMDDDEAMRVMEAFGAEKPAEEEGAGLEPPATG